MSFTPKFVDLVRNFTTTVGTGDFALGPAVNGFTGFTEALQPGDAFYYSAIGVDKPAEREVGRGTLLANGRIAREPIGGSKTNFSSGTKSLSLIAAAEWFTSMQSGASTDMPGLAAARADLSALNPTKMAALLAEPGREGMFVFDGSDLSALVSADRSQGLYVPPDADTSGASGAWVRRFNGAVDAGWFGLTAGAGHAATNDAAIAALFDTLRARAVIPDAMYQGLEPIQLPAGDFYFGATIELTDGTFIISGEDSGIHAGRATRLHFPPGVTGIRTQRFDTESASDGPVAAHRGADGSVIRNLALIGGYAGAEADVHGIQLRTRANISNVRIENFEGDGIYARADVLGAGAGGYRGDVSRCVITNVVSTGNRNGIHFQGGDANVNLISGCDFTVNRQWGVDDDCFLGNTYVAVHAASNGAGPFRTTNENAPNVFLGCYSEMDQTASDFSQNTIVLGGLHGAGLAGGAYVRGSLDQVRLNNTWVDGNFAAAGQVSLGRGDGAASDTVVALNNTNSNTTFIGYYWNAGVPSRDGTLRFSHGNGAFLHGTAGLILGVGDTIAGTSTDVVSVQSDGVHVAGSGVFSGGVSAVGAITTSSASSGLGYAAGAGGAVTQTTSKSTGVTINKASGKITTHGASMAAAAIVSFVVTNSVITATDTINLNLASGNTGAGAYRYWVESIAAGSFKIVVENRSGGSLSEALVFNFAVLKAVSA